MTPKTSLCSVAVFNLCNRTFHVRAGWGVGLDWRGTVTLPVRAGCLAGFLFQTGVGNSGAVEIKYRDDLTAGGGGLAAGRP